MYLTLVCKLFLYVSLVNSRASNQTVNEQKNNDVEIVYSLGSDLGVDTVEFISKPEIMLKVGSFGCTGCLIDIGEQLDSLNIDSFHIVYYCLNETYTHREFIKSYLSSMNDANSKLKLFRVRYKIYLAKSNQLNAKSPFVVKSCDGTTSVTYTYEDIFYKNVRLSRCE